MKNILIIEDSKYINNLVKEELTKLNYNCFQAYDFKKAEMFLSNKKFDLIILDLHLPDGEGYELINKVKDLSASRVVVLTANKEKQLREELFHYGILDYIIKDKNLAYAISEIHKILLHIDSSNKEEILVIDDSEFICRQIKMVLEPRNYNVTIAKSAQEGFSKLSGDKKFDLITLDMELPDIHGLDVLEKIKSNPKFLDIPVLVISGVTDPDMIRKIYKKGGSEFIRKPFIVEEFALKVDLWCDYKVQHQRALEQKDKILSQQSKMATMGEMLENIIHQSKQPLSIITTSASGVALKNEHNILTPEVLNESIDIIIDSAKHLSDTMTGFKNFYKQENKKKMVNISELLEKSFYLTHSKFHNRKINLVKNFVDIDLKGFDIELLQVFINILNNARDELEKIDPKKDKYIFIDTLIEDNSCKIIFTDNAGGVPQDILPKIFDSHFTTKPGDKGTGIGLFMSKEIIDKHHNGTITVQNSIYTYNDIKYLGAKFTITIPLD